MHVYTASFEVKAVVRGYHQYKATTPAQQLALQPLYFTYWPLFLLLFESIAERTSELEDAIDVDGQFLAISLPLEVPK